jgi:hypothetical protein
LYTCDRRSDRLIGARHNNQLWHKHLSTVGKSLVPTFRIPWVTE